MTDLPPVLKWPERESDLRIGTGATLRLYGIQPSRSQLYAV